MSYYLKIVGSAAAVKAQLVTETNISPVLRAAIQEICEDPGYGGTPTGILVEGSGHTGTGSCITNLRVERVTLLPEPPPIATPDPSTAAAPSPATA